MLLGGGGGGAFSLPSGNVKFREVVGVVGEGRGVSRDSVGVGVRIGGSWGTDSPVGPAGDKIPVLHRLGMPGGDSTATLCCSSKEVLKCAVSGEPLDTEEVLLLNRAYGSKLEVDNRLGIGSSIPSSSSERMLERLPLMLDLLPME